MNLVEKLAIKMIFDAKNPPLEIKNSKESKMSLD